MSEGSGSPFAYVNCAYPGCARTLLRKSDIDVPQFCSKEHRDGLPLYEPYVVSDERLGEIRAMFTERDDFDNWDLRAVPGVSMADLVGAIYDLLGERDDRQ